MSTCRQTIQIKHAESLGHATGLSAAVLLGLSTPLTECCIALVRLVFWKTLARVVS
jgi:hypothetical protein